MKIKNFQLTNNYINKFNSSYYYLLKFAFSSNKFDNLNLTRDNSLRMSSIDDFPPKLLKLGSMN